VDGLIVPGLPTEKFLRQMEGLSEATKAKLRETAHMRKPHGFIFFLSVGEIRESGRRLGGARLAS
jgi:hypothetical protein